MATPEQPKPGILALLADPTPMQPLLAHLHGLGHTVDVVQDLAGARTSFFSSGGHDCLLVAPDVRPGLANQVMASLRAVDPELPMATFGPGPTQEPKPARLTVLAAYHPGSRAGTGAFLRFLGSVRVR
ncbi:MAG: hypothetical protein JNK15_04390 [Planctomycetes bacterium]|nr:hypothetical protein [Planctomycetota bacterium]